MTTWKRVCSLAIVAAGWAVASGCNSYDPGEGGCSSDDQCRGSRICVDGECAPAGGSDAAPHDGPRVPPVPPPDDVDQPDGSGPDDPIDGGGDPPRVDIGEPRDGGGPPDPDAVLPPDIGPTPDGGAPDAAGPPMTCHEFATCQFLMCETFDYSCKQQYSARTSETEIGKLDDRQACMQEHCGGISDNAERQECRADNCASAWNVCGHIDGGADGLNCSEFHACVDLCNGSDEPASCRTDCQERATDAASVELQQFHQCAAGYCEGMEGAAYLECLRDNCDREMRTCFGC